MSKEQKKDDGYQDVHDKIHKEVYEIDRHIAKVRDIHNSAVAKANKELKYDFHKLNDADIQDKYIKTVHDHIESEIAKELKIGKGTKFQKDFIESMGGVAKRGIEDIVSTRGADFRPEALQSKLYESISQFARPKYAQTISELAKDKSNNKHIAKYLGVDKKINSDLLTEDVLAQLMVSKGFYKELKDEHIPDRIRVTKRKKKAA